MVVLHDRVGPDTTEHRLIQAADSCVRRFGWAKTTVGDVAHEAEVSRATFYRVFPGGRDAVLEALRRSQLFDFFSELSEPLDGGDSLVGTLADTMVAANSALVAHEQLQYQLANEPGEVLRQLTFDGLDQVIAASRVFVGPHLARFVSRKEANKLAEWAARVVLTYALEPSPHLDLGDAAAVEDLVRRKVIAAD